MVPCLSARLLATHSRDGPQLTRVDMEFTGRLVSSCGFSREGRMVGSQEGSLQSQALDLNAQMESAATLLSAMAAAFNSAAQVY